MADAERGSRSGPDEREKELTIEFTLQEKLYRTRIPAGADMTPYLQADGSLCILCLAEAFGYESADPLD